MKKIGFTFAFLLVATFASFGQNKCLEQMLWLEGKWVGEIDSQEFVEDWKQMNGQLIGKGFLLSPSKDTISIEDIYINCFDNGSLVYAASPSADYYVTFVATEDFDKKFIWVFKNPENDFPKKIKYLKISTTEMKITVSDDTRSFEYTLIKTK